MVHAVSASPPTNVVVEISTFECTPRNSVNASSSYWPSYSDLQKLPVADIKLLDRVSAITKSGVRAAMIHVTIPALGISPGASPQQNRADGAITHLFKDGEFGTRAEAEPIVGPDGITVDTSILYRFRMPEYEKASSEISLNTSFCSWEGYPVVLHISPIPNKEGKFLAVTAMVRLVNAGGWNLEKAQAEADNDKKASVP